MKASGCASVLSAIDLFSGCGGISLGLESAGFEVLAGVDVEPKFMTTFATNFPRAKALGLDLTRTTPSEFMDQVGILPGELHLLVGGPPCQGFSKNVPRARRTADSLSNKLILTCSIVVRFARA